MNLLTFKALNSQRWHLHYKVKKGYEGIQANRRGELEVEWQTVHVNAKYLVDIKPIEGTEDYWPKAISHVVHWVGDKHALSHAMVTEDVYKSILKLLGENQ